jgi:glyoxylase-like metal-dependent hydrolase (beta-lactamase superfamily II)
MEVLAIKSRSQLFRFKTPQGWYLNIHLIKADRHDFIIDTGLGEGYISQVKAYLSDKKPAIVINTHHHWDHVWGNCFLKDALCVSHVLCRDMILSTWKETTEKHCALISGDIKIRLPDLVFKDELIFPEDAIRIFYTPGHTADSVSVLDEKDMILNAGDNIGDTAEEIVPRLDCSLPEYKRTLKKYKELDFDLCISGHNTVLNKEAIVKIADHIGGF